MFNSLFGVLTAYAQTTGANTISPVAKFVGTVNRLIINPLIILMFAAGLVYFLFGVIQYFLNGSPEDRNTGKRHILWGLIGMFIMFSVFAIIKFIERSIGASATQNLGI